MRADLGVRSVGSSTRSERSAYRGESAAPCARFGGSECMGRRLRALEVDDSHAKATAPSSPVLLIARVAARTTSGEGDSRLRPPEHAEHTKVRSIWGTPEESSCDNVRVHLNSVTVIPRRPLRPLSRGRLGDFWRARGVVMRCCSISKNARTGILCSLARLASRNRLSGLPKVAQYARRVCTLFSTSCDMRCETRDGESRALHREPRTLSGERRTGSAKPLLDGALRLTMLA